MAEKCTSCYEGAVSWYMRVCRLAVAVALIKIRPSGGVRLFTQSLANRLKQQDQNWRTKAQDLHEDLLRLRQELLLTRSLLKTSAGAEQALSEHLNKYKTALNAAHSNYVSAIISRASNRPNVLFDMVNKLTQPPTHDVYASDELCDQEVVKAFSPDDQQLLKSDSGCDTDISLQTQIHSSTGGHCLPLIPPNSQTDPLQDRTWLQDHRLLKHMHFLQCLSGLRRGHDPLLCLDDCGDVVWDSVVQLLDSLVEVFRQAYVEHRLHRPDLLRHAAEVAAQTLSQGRTLHQHFSRVEDLMREMISLLLTNQQLNVFSVQGVMSECVIALGGSHVIRPALVQLLMSQIIQRAQHLWDTCQRSSEEHHDDVEWICYENSFYVFWLLEHLAQSPEDHHDVIQELVKQLETLALRLSDEFPLFSLYMWRIAGLYRNAQT
ncbi:meiosis-specific protein MEI4 [Myxocyprinus asiaticus]|uniref:meiosis-specific protein MEI4 n=1 Tax=Myxocyprinus asiaticus TaxID=70543 RepID=UPI002222E47D|nr:meiosis-specific protein MEI4 [Myxocyprinus asiaticus]